MLANGFGAVVEAVLYDDDAPWDFLADGFGPSLERVCLTAGALLPENWRASPMGAPDAFGGTPLAPCAAAACPPVALPRPPVRISEVMYHPVLEEDYEDRHEFIEIVNTGAAPVDLAGWRFAGYARSRDLVTWTNQKLVPAMEHEPETFNVWAPEVFYDERGQQFVIQWAATIPGRSGPLADHSRAAPTTPRHGAAPQPASGRASDGA